MKVKEGLFFDKHFCELIGFTDLGDINNDLNQLEQCQSSSVGTVVSHVLFMVYSQVSIFFMPTLQQKVSY